MNKPLAIMILIIATTIGIGFYFKKNMLQTPTKTTNNLNLSDVQKKIEETLHLKTDFFPDENVVKITIPRSDIPFSINKAELNPFMGTTTWIAFQKGLKPGVEVMIMGDLALLQHEVNHVMKAALDHNIEITALHNHFFFEEPRIFFMHIECEGSVVETLQGIKAIIDAYQNAPAEKKAPQISSTHSISGEALEKIMTVKGTAKDGMFKFVMGRKTHAGCGCPVGKNMGINSWAAFAGTDEQAMVVGDLALFEPELQNVLKTFKNNGIDVVAIHNHMIYELPRVMFVHYIGYGKATDLAQAIKKTIDETSTLK